MRLRTYIVPGESNVVGQHLLQFRQDTAGTATDLANGIWFNFNVTRQHRNNPSRLGRRILQMPRAPRFGEIRAIGVNIFARRISVHLISKSPFGN